jgi:hypothetical protein
MLMLRVYYQTTIVAIVFFLFLPVLMHSAGDAGLNIGNNSRHEFITISQAATKEEALRPALSITPREVDFGDIGPENVANTLIDRWSGGVGRNGKSTADRRQSGGRTGLSASVP